MKNIVFDFDGTMANTMPVIIEIAEDMLKINLNDQKIEQYRNMTAKQVLKEARIPIYKLPRLLVKGRPILQRRMNEVELFKGLDQVIKELSNNGHQLYVVSSNSLGIINGFLNKFELKKYFTRIYGNVGIFSKAQALKKVVKREGFIITDTIYIGDEVRDIEAAKKVGMSIISVSWGYNGKQILLNSNPNFIADSPTDIIKYISETKTVES